MPSDRPLVDLYVLDTVADDIEEYDNISRRVAKWDPAALSQLLASLQRLVQQELIEACMLTADGRSLTGAGPGVWPVIPVPDLWFRMTSRGRMVHSAWEPPDETIPR